MYSLPAIKLMPSLLLAGIVLISSEPQAQEINVGIANFGPYFEGNGTPGLFVELIQETFALLPQYKLNFVSTPLPNYRLAYELNNGEIDAAANIFSKTQIKGCLSQPFFMLPPLNGAT